MHKRGRHVAVRFRDGTSEQPPAPKPPNPPRRVKWQKKQPITFVKLTPKEQLLDQSDGFERLKPKLLHQSWVMYDMQYGVDLQSFVQSIDPLKTFQIMKTLSHPEFLNPRSTTTNRDIFDLVKKEVSKYQIKVCSAYLSSQTLAEPSVYLSNKDDDLPLVIDTGVSFCLTPNISDFVSLLQANTATLTGLNSETPVAGAGTAEWTIQDVTGLVRTICCEAFYVPHAKIWQFSLQQCFMEGQAGSLFYNHLHTHLSLHDGSTLEFPYQDTNQLPLMSTKDYLQFLGPGDKFPSVYMSRYGMETSYVTN